MTDIYQVDAFSDRLFSGNPAAVVPLPAWPDDHLLQCIALENNLAETAYIVESQNQWEIRWFSPTSEVALCGHATLAAAHVVFQHLDYKARTITFQTREAGPLPVTLLDDRRLLMSFPAIEISASTVSEQIIEALGATPSELWKGYYSEDQFDYVAVLGAHIDVVKLQPDSSCIEALGSRGLIATSRSDDCDFVSRYFAPAFGIPEDPVTGSAHCLLAPYWADKLDKNILQAKQVSARGGTLECRVNNSRVELVGHATDYLRGHLYLPQI